jgi:hypothetical protein
MKLQQGLSAHQYWLNVSYLPDYRSLGPTRHPEKAEPQIFGVPI